MSFIPSNIKHFKDATDFLNSIKALGKSFLSMSTKNDHNQRDNDEKQYAREISQSNVNQSKEPIILPKKLDSEEFIGQFNNDENLKNASGTENFNSNNLPVMTGSDKGGNFFVLQIFENYI